MLGNGRTPTRSERVYRVMLKAYPKQFREEYGAHMVQAFGDLRRRETGRAGTGGLVALWVRASVDLLISASAERSKTAAPVLSSSGMARFGGLAAMVGGALGAMLVVQPIAVPYGGPFDPRMWLFGVFDLLGTFSGLLTSVAALGLYACVVRGSRKLATLGLVLASISAVAFAGIGIYQSLTMLSSGYSEGFSTPLWIVEVGLASSLLLGVVLLRTQALGRCSAFPLIFWLLPLVVPFLFSLLAERLAAPTMWALTVMDATLILPGLLANLVWVLMGYLLWFGRGKDPDDSAQVA